VRNRSNKSVKPRSSRGHSEVGQSRGIPVRRWAALWTDRQVIRRRCGEFWKNRHPHQQRRARAALLFLGTLLKKITTVLKRVNLKGSLLHFPRRSWKPPHAGPSPSEKLTSGRRKIINIISVHEELLSRISFLLRIQGGVKMLTTQSFRSNSHHYFGITSITSRAWWPSKRPSTQILLNDPVQLNALLGTFP